MKKIIVIFIIWRISLFIIAGIAPKVIPTYGEKFPYVYILTQESRLPYWVNSFGGFDGVYYLRLAKDGYAHKFTQAFFPLYPILIRIFSYPLQGNYLTSALLISNLSFLGALILFYRILKNHYKESVAVWACAFLAAFPTSFYFGSVYTESIFFLLILLSLYFFDKNKILLASVFGFFATFTRLVGIFLLPAFLKLKKKSSLYLILIPLGLFTYMVYLYVEFKNPFYFLTSQSIFGQERSTEKIILLPQVFYRYFNIFLTVRGALLLNALFEFLSTVFALVILFLSFKVVKKEWVIFAALSTILPTLTGTLASMPRYVLLAFPIFIYLATIKSSIVKTIILITFSLLLVISTIVFTRGYWVA